MIEYKRKGSIEVVCGSMFSGKSEELIRRVRRSQIAKQNTLIFKHAIDTRYEDDKVCSHNGAKLEAIAIDNALDILTYDLGSIDVVAVDEAQFFQNNIVEVVMQMANNGIRVIVAGLDMDFRALPFGPMPSLMALAESVTKLQAVCAICGAPAWCSQRLADGEVADRTSPIVLVGAIEAYEPRCRIHYKFKN